MKTHLAAFPRKLLLTAFFSRICIILLQFVFNVIIPDHVSDAFISPILRLPRNAYDNIIFYFLSGFVRWDAHYFLHISIYGYVYENTLAFFPGYPVCVRVFAAPLQLIFNFLNVSSIHLISSIIVNVVTFVLSARILFFLSLKELRSEELARTTVILFCANPASIFFTAPYSEALFSCLSFCAMLSEDSFHSSVFVALSALVRSNGIINLGFPLYHELKYFINDRHYRNKIKFLFRLFGICLCSLSGFLLYQFYCYYSFCNLQHHFFDEAILHTAFQKNYILKGTRVSDMCSSILPYSYIQNHYWNVGFLHYFEFKQLPNFLLALPIIYFVMKENFNYFVRNRYLVLTLGMAHRGKNLDANIFPYVVHSTVLLFVCFFFIHIQVTTRLLCSSSPAIYWLCAALLHRKERGSPNFHYTYFKRLSSTTRLTLIYCLSYFFCGTVLFCNFYPWT